MIFFNNYKNEIIQTLLIMLTTFIGILAIQKDLNGKTQKYVRNGWIIIGVSVLIMCLTILLTFSSAYQNNKSKEKSDSIINDIVRNNDTLKVKNDTLTARLGRTELSLAKKIDTTTGTLLGDAAKKAIQASKQLENASSKFETAIFGGVGYPFFAPVLGNKRNTYQLVLIGEEKENQYDLAFNIYDYDKLLNCKSVMQGTTPLLDRNCEAQARIAEGRLASIRPNQPINYDSLIFNKSWPLTRKFVINLYTRRSEYVQELYITSTGYAYRIYDKKNRIKRDVLKQGYSNVEKFDWNTEFPLTQNYQLVDIQ